MNDTALIPHAQLEEKISSLVGRSVPIEMGEDQISVVQFWRVLQKRYTFVLGTLGIVVFLVVAASLLLPKRYDASARILLDLEGNDDLGLEQIVMPIGLDLNTKLQTQIRIVQSDTIAASVIKQLGLHQNKDFAGKSATPTGLNFDDVDLKTRSRLMQSFHKAVHVELIPKTQIVEVHF